jgi:hypothetical protein
MVVGMAILLDESYVNRPSVQLSNASAKPISMPVQSIQSPNNANYRAFIEHVGYA